MVVVNCKQIDKWTASSCSSPNLSPYKESLAAGFSSLLKPLPGPEPIPDHLSLLKHDVTLIFVRVKPQH